MKKILLIGLLALSITGISMITPNDASDKKKIGCCCEECTCKECICELDSSDCKGCRKNEECGECRGCCEENRYDCCNYHRDHCNRRHIEIQVGRLLWKALLKDSLHNPCLLYNLFYFPI